MKIAIIGASGFVGSALLNEAARRGHTITAISRHPENIHSENGNITPVKADVFEIQELADALAGHEAILNAFNPGWDDPNIFEDFLKGFESIQEATKKAKVKRLLVVGGAGSLEIAPGKQLVDTPDFPAEYKEGAKAARDYLDIIKKEKDIDWTFLSPAILMHQGIKTGRTGKYRIGTDNPVFDDDGVSKISAEDLAVALIDELEKPQFLNRRFTVAY